MNSELLLLDKISRSNKKDLAVLTIAGGYDDYLRLLADERVSPVLTVNRNPHQLALARLRLASACSDLSIPELVTFMRFNKVPGSTNQNDETD